jgi:hypothetical protein
MSNFNDNAWKINLLGDNFEAEKNLNSSSEKINVCSKFFFVRFFVICCQISNEYCGSKALWNRVSRKHEKLRPLRVKYIKRPSNFSFRRKIGNGEIFVGGRGGGGKEERRERGRKIEFARQKGTRKGKEDEMG